MNGALDILELAIAISAKNHNPTVLNADFLKYSGIVPNDWELARPPVFSAQAAQVVFKNGVNIIAQVGRVNFSEPLKTAGPEEAKIQGIAEKYIHTLPQADYQAVDLNFRRLLAVGEQEDAARQYIFDRLLASGPWANFGKAPVRAAINFVYTLDQGQLNLNVNEAKLNLQNQQSYNAVVFTGNFRYALTGETPEARLDDLSGRINSWQTNLQAFQEVVNNGLLAQADLNPVLVVRDA